MCQHDNVNHGACTLELNSELQQAHSDLLSAHRSTHKLRLAYSSDDLVRYGRRDLLRKSASTASELHAFYAEIEKRLTPAPPVAVTVQPSHEQITQAVGWLSTYLNQQRDNYAPIASPLSREWKDRLWPYFSADLLNHVRVVELRGARVAIPEFFSQARALGFEPPEITHMDSLTFVDVVAFNEELTDRSLFHALVHAVQVRILGLERYAELWVRSFIRTRAHFTVPLEVHAFSLASKFMHPGERFSVEDHVMRWTLDERY